MAHGVGTICTERRQPRTPAVAAGPSGCSSIAQMAPPKESVELSGRSDVKSHSTSEPSMLPVNSRHAPRRRSRTQATATMAGASVLPGMRCVRHSKQLTHHCILRCVRSLFDVVFITGGQAA